MPEPERRSQEEPEPCPGALQANEDGGRVRVFATYNIKGGVGKTATAVNLAYLAAKDGARTLIWDLDPQAAATFYFRVRAKVKGGAKKLLKGKRPLDATIRGTDFEGLDILPADFTYRNMDLDLVQSKKPTRQLASLLLPLSLQYDYLFLDCAPSISLVSESIFVAADVLLSPTIPTTLSLRTLDQLDQCVHDLDVDLLDAVGRGGVGHHDGDVDAFPNCLDFLRGQRHVRSAVLPSALCAHRWQGVVNDEPAKDNEKGANVFRFALVGQSRRSSAPAATLDR